MIPVVTTESVVTGGCSHLNRREVLVFTYFEQGDVKRSATEVEHENELILFALVEAVSQRCCGWLVDDAQHVESGNLAGLFGCLALRVVEVCGNGDNRVGDLVAEVGFSVALELHQRAS